MKMKRIAAMLSAAVIMTSAAAPAVYAGWEKENGKTYYYDENDDKLKGLHEIDGLTYYFDRNGVMQKGWQTIRGNTCYFRKDGSMVKGPASIGGRSYYFDDNGYKKSGNVLSGGKLYKYYENGASPTLYKNTIVVVDGKRYCADANGKISKGLKKIGSNYYYFGSNGYSVSTTVEDGGFTYVLDAEEGLISRRAVAVSPSKIKIKVGTYSHTLTSMPDFTCRNNSSGNSFIYSGVIKNLAGQPSCAVKVYVDLYDEDGDLIDILTITTPSMKVGEKCEFKGQLSVDRPVYTVKFRIEKIR